MQSYLWETEGGKTCPTGAWLSCAFLVSYPRLPMSQHLPRLSLCSVFHPCLFYLYIASLPEELQQLSGPRRTDLAFSLPRSLTWIPAGLGPLSSVFMWTILNVCSFVQLSSYICNIFLQILQVQICLTDRHPKCFCKEHFSFPLFVFLFPNFCHFADNLTVMCLYGLSSYSSFHMNYWYIKCHHWLASDLSLFSCLLEFGTNTFVLCLVLFVTL